MTKISQLVDIGANLAAGDEFIIRDVSEAGTPNKKVTSSGFIDYIIAQGTGAGFTQIAAGVGPLARALASSSGATGTLTFSTAAATTLIERACIDPSGRLLIGTSTARDNFFNTSGLGGLLQVEGANNSARRLISNVYGTAGAAGPLLCFGKHRGNSVGDNTVVQSGDECGVFSFQGSDGTQFVEAAQIGAYVDGTPGADNMPGRLVFSTTADGAASPTARMIINRASRTRFFGTRDLAIDCETSGSVSIFGLNPGGAGGALRLGCNTKTVDPTSGVSLSENATSFGTFSDERIKTNLVPIENGLDKVGTLRAVTGRYTQDPEETRRSFLIAQDVQQVLPEAVYAEVDEMQTLNLRYTEVIPLLVAALKESKERIEQLESAVATLQAS